VSCAAIADYLERAGVDDDIVFDAIRVRLIEIGEAVKDIDPKLLESEPAIPWTEIARMRDQLAHRSNRWLFPLRTFCTHSDCSFIGYRIGRAVSAPTVSGFQGPAMYRDVGGEPFAAIHGRGGRCPRCHRSYHLTHAGGVDNGELGNR
jgi:hypothetical protein